MFGVIDNYDFGEMEVMKYYAPPANWSKEKRATEVKMRVFSNNFLAAEKKDGFFGKFVKDDEGNMLLYSRSRNVNKQFINKIAWVPHLMSFFNDLPNGTCLLGELYLPNQPGSKCVQTILGCLEQKAIERQKKGEKINFYVFDCLAYNGENYLNKGYEFRTNKVQSFISDNSYIQFAHYYRGNDLWLQLQEILANNGEGMVIIHKDALYEPGKRPSKTTLKVKKELQETLDVVIIGANAPTREYGGKEIDSWKYWQNMLTGEKLNGDYFFNYTNGEAYEPITKMYYLGGAGSLILGAYKDGKLVKVGNLSGLDEEILLNWKDYVGKVAEVTAMEIMRDDNMKFTGLRHPKFLQFRNDKTPKECDWYEMFGE